LSDTADLGRSRDEDVRFVPKADIKPLFDHFVGTLLERQRHVEAKRFCGLEVDR
jgi:hypothetical protein